MSTIKDEYQNGDPYEVDFSDYFHKERLRNTLDILKDVSHNSKVLDVGCGRGYFTKHFVVNGNKVLGIDYSKNAIEFAQNNFGNESLLFEVLDVVDLIEKKDEFDVVIANNLIEHIENPNAFLRECHRILKPDGFLIISTPNLYSFRNIISIIFKKSVKYRHSNHVCEYSRSQIKKFFQKNDFKLVKIVSQFQIKRTNGIIVLLFNIVNWFLAFLHFNFLCATNFYLVKKK